VPDLQSGVPLVSLLAMTFVLGMASVWLAAAIRPRYRSNVQSAMAAGVAVIRHPLPPDESAQHRQPETASAFGRDERRSTPVPTDGTERRMMTADLEHSAIEFTRMWCELFVGDAPAIERAMQHFSDDASILIPSVPYRLRRADDEQEITFSHLVDGRGHVHFWQVLEPEAIIHGDTAVVSYYARYNVGRTGESTMKYAKESLVLVRSGDGWRIIHMHNSAI
jgi:hypothetical protein